MTLDNLATMVTTIMNKLESKTMVSPPTHRGDNDDQIPRSPPKSTCKNQAQSKPSRIGASSGNPIDVVDVSYVPSEDENPPKQSVKITRSKDVKFKGVSGATGNSEVGTKVARSPKPSRKKKVTRGGGSMGRGTGDGSAHQVSAGGGTHEGVVNEGGGLELGGGPEKNPEGGSGVFGIGGSSGVEEGNKVGGQSGVIGKGDNGEAASGDGGSEHGGKGQTQIEESNALEGGDVGVIAEETVQAMSPGRGVSDFSVQVRSVSMSPSKLGGNGDENNAPGSEVSPTKWPHISSPSEAYNPTKLLIFNVHGTFLDTSLLTQPNPNPNIRVTKKTTTRRCVFRPWMIDFLRRCMKKFRVAFWGIKSREYMDEVLHEILPVFQHMEGHKPLFSWCAMDCEIIQKSDEVTLWGKPLTKVWKKWACWNDTNTIIVDHHAPRLECNSHANVIVPPSFYVAKMKDIAEDNDYLKLKLWPTLEGIYTYQDIASFWSTFNVSGMQAGVCEVHCHSKSIAPRPPCTPFADPGVPKCGGEGTCGP